MQSILRSAALIAALAATLAAQGPPPPPPPPPPLPPVPVPFANPITPDKVNLGKALFWDEQMSSTRTVACGTCHMPEAGGADLRSRTNAARHPGADGLFFTADDVLGSAGVIANQQNGSYVADATFGLAPQVTSRKAPSAINAAFHAGGLFWDGRAGGTFVDPETGGVVLPMQGALESQAAAPPVSSVEMAHFARDWNDVAARIENVAPLALASAVPPALAAWIGQASYPDLFERTFGSRDVTPVRILEAIATYERTLVSDQAPIDAFIAGNPGALTPQEMRGFGVFTGPGRCVACHQGALFGGTPGPRMFLNIGVRPAAEDHGRFAITGNPVDDGAFKVPSLRNVGLRGPFFHNGGQPSLQAVVGFYNRGGDFHQNQTPLIQPLNLPPPAQQDLIAFLTGALTDPRVANAQPPFDHPQLFAGSNRMPAGYGIPTAGTGGLAPRLIAIEPPMLGNPSWTVAAADGLPGALGLLLLGLAPQPPGTMIVGTTLNVAPTHAVAVPLPPLAPSQRAGGNTSLSLVIPANASLQGVSLFLQGFWPDPAAPAGVAASAGVRAGLFAAR